MKLATTILATLLGISLLTHSNFQGSSSSSDLNQEIRELRLQQRSSLDGLRQIFEIKYQQGITGTEELSRIRLRLLEIDLTLADSDEKRIEILEMAVAETFKVLEETTQRSNITGKREDVLEAEAAWLQAKINLLLERQRQQQKQATQDPSQQK